MRERATLPTDSTLLGWRPLDDLGAESSPVVFCAGRDLERDLVLGRLAAEHVRTGGRVLWLGRGRASQPLGWMDIPHRVVRVDAIPEELRPDPYCLEPAHAVAWAAHCLGVRRRSVRRLLARAVALECLEEGDSDGLLKRVQCRLIGFAASGQVDPEEIDSLAWDSLDHREVGLGPASWAEICRVLVVSGSPRDYARSGAAAALLVLAAATASERGESPVLIILDGVWDALAPSLRDLMRAVLGDHVRLGGGRAVIAAEDPGAWEADLSGLTLLESGVPVVSSDFAGRWPVSWGSSKPATVPSPPSPCIAVPTAMVRLGEPIQWRWLRCPEDPAEGIPGVSTVALDESGL